jgi:type IV pilus assembly protein PilB
MRGGRKPLGQSLVEQGRLSQEGLTRALDEQRRAGTSLREAILRLGLAPESAILDYYEEQLGIPRVDPGTYVLEPEIVRLLPDRVARQYTVLPLFRIGSTLTVAMADPLDVVALDEVKKTTGLQVEVVVSPEAQIHEAIDRMNPSAPGLDQLAREQALRQVAAEVAARPEEDGPIIRFVNAVVQQALREGASDLHLEPDESSFRIRLRVDGVLREVSIQSKTLYAPVVSRVKVMAALDIAERRLPQDGRIRMNLAGRDLDLRVSTFPTIHGENVVLRLLDRSADLIGLPELGLQPEPRAALERLIRKPNGIVLVTGPTGSGKTTTLYACIHRINGVERNIVTLEDPVEYHLPSIRQTQVDPDAGLTFARGLRALLRQDPDVILVGEIRDAETAEIAVRSALTGHLVLTTLHTNDASGALPRLLDMRLEPYLLSSALLGVVAQRLVRKVCDKCRRPVTPPADIARALGIDPAQGAFAHGAGCRACSGSGYRGRVGIFEVLEMNEEIQALVHQRAPAEEVARAARRAGMRTLRDDAVAKAAAGLTTLEEVLRVTKSDGTPLEDESTLPAGS